MTEPSDEWRAGFMAGWWLAQAHAEQVTESEDDE